MEKKHWYYIITCTLLIMICSMLYMNYYKEYVAPKSYTIGTFKPRDYTDLEIKSELTSEDVLFSQNLDNVTFKVDESTNIATYELKSSPISFNGEFNDYILYINNHIVSNLDLSAGSISGTHSIKYYDVDKSVIATSTLNLSFASYTKHLLFKISLPKDDIGLLMRYFEVNDFIVTLALQPYATNKTSSIQPTNDYQVSFVVDNEVISSQNVSFGGYATLPDYDLSNCAWSIDGINIVDVSSYEILGNTTFTLIRPYVLTFNANGGELEIVNKTIYANQEIGELPVPTYSDYVFAGWYTSDGILITSTTKMGSSNLNLYAHWTSPVYNVSCEYDVNTQSYVVTGSEYKDTTTITIPSTFDDGVNGVALVTAIGDNAFYDFETMTNIIIPNSIVEIGNYAFGNCRALTKVTLPEGLTTLGNDAFSCCNNLNSINIPVGITEIGDSVFYACGFTTITIPSHVVSIGKYAFNTCYKLESVLFEENSQLQIIGNGAFAECSQLSNVVLPSSITKIDTGAFYNCTSLTTMTIKAINPPTLVNVNAISSATTTIYIYGKLDVYSNANNWSSFVAKFVEM